MNQPAGSPPLRVLFALQLDPSQKFGSMEEQLYALALGFQDQGGLVLPLYLGQLHPSTAQLYQQRGLRSEVLSLAQFRVATLRALLRIIRENKVGAINWNFYEPINNRYLWALKFLRPTLRHDLTDHISRLAVPPGTGASLKSRLKARLLKAYRRIFCVSDYVLSLNQADGLGKRLVRWHHFVNTDRFAPNPQIREQTRSALGDRDHFVIAMVAFLRREKGGHIAIEALAKLPERCVLWIVGGGVEEVALRQQAEQLGIANRVRFLGNQADVAPYIQGADCVVCPSTWVEAAGLANIEALACGVPVVASRIGGIPEIIRDGETGLLVEPGDSQMLADAIKQLVDQPEFRSKLAQNARDVALREFSTPRRVQEIIDHYRV